MITCLRSYWKSLCCAAVVLYASLVNDLPMLIVPIFSWRDKFFHCLVYAILGIVLGYDMNKANVGVKNYWVLLFFLPVSYGGLIELIQNYCCTNRVGDWYDFIANTVGVLIAMIICRIFVMK